MVETEPPPPAGDEPEPTDAEMEREAIRDRIGTFEDRAKGFSPQTFTLGTDLTPRPLQEQAVAAWREQNRRGVVVLPTGAGKSLLSPGPNTWRTMLSAYMPQL